MKDPGPVNVLVAYPYLKGRAVERFEKADPESFRLLVDSGAFTAFNAGTAIDVRDYIAFLRGLSFNPWRYFALDVIGNANGTKANYERMLDAGLRPIPVWTEGQSLDEFERLFETSDLVGIGGLVGAKGKGHGSTARWRVQEAMKRARGRKVHWLGYARASMIRANKPYSVDTSTWSAGTRYGNLKLYQGNGRFKVFLSPFVKSCTAAGSIYREPSVAESALLLGYGVRPEELLLPSFWGSRGRLHEITLRSYRRFMYECERNGTLLFIAAGDVDELQRVRL